MNRPAIVPHVFRVAIVGAATLKGRELKEVLDEMNFPVADVKLLDDDESLGQLDQIGDEATFIQPADPEHFRNVDFAFFASDAAFTGRHWQSALQAGATVLDLSYALYGERNVSARSPWIEKELERESGREPGHEDLTTTAVVIAHPAASVLALLLLQARTFHAHTFSVYIQFDGEIKASALATALAGEHVTIVDPAEDGPSNVNAAGQGNVLVSVRRDARNANGFWIWAAADNLKIAAISAVECAATLSTMRPLGKVQ